MRECFAPEDFEDAFNTAQRESANAFGDDTMYIEKLVVHPRYRTPHHAILFVLLVSAAAPFFGRTVLGWLVDMSALGAAVAYGYTSLVAWRCARAQHHAPTVVTGLLGVLFSAAFVVLLLVPIPGLGASLGPQAYACLVAWVVLGVIFFASTKRSRQRGRRR